MTQGPAELTELGVETGQDMAVATWSHGPITTSCAGPKQRNVQGLEGGEKGCKMGWGGLTGRPPSPTMTDSQLARPHHQDIPRPHPCQPAPLSGERKAGMML